MLSYYAAIHRTRFADLGYVKDAPGLWRVVTVEDKSRVGPCYATKAELFSDLERYATEYGCNGPANVARAADTALVRERLESFAPWEGESDPALKALEAFNRLHPEG